MDLFLNSGIFGLAIVMAFLLLLVAGIVIVATTRSRATATTFALLAFLPLLIGLFGTSIGYRKVDAAAQMLPPEIAEHPQSVVAAGRREARIPVYLGAGASAALLVVAGCGIALTRKSNKTQQNKPR